jgi:hypothetical protein
MLDSLAKRPGHVGPEQAVLQHRRTGTVNLRSVNRTNPAVCRTWRSEPDDRGHDVVDCRGKGQDHEHEHGEASARRQLAESSARSLVDNLSIGFHRIVST